jgi:hypothetical protein
LTTALERDRGLEVQAMSGAPCAVPEVGGVPVTLTSPRRIGALALGAALFVAACSSSGATTAPTTAPQSTAPQSPGESMATVSGAIVVASV